jgi:hypothetical protein
MERGPTVSTHPSSPTPSPRMSQAIWSNLAQVRSASDLKQFAMKEVEGVQFRARTALLFRFYYIRVIVVSLVLIVAVILIFAVDPFWVGLVLLLVWFGLMYALIFRFYQTPLIVLLQGVKGPLPSI